VSAGNVSFAPRRRFVPRVGAGLAALSYPVVMVVLAVGVGWRHGGDLQDFALSFVAAVMILIALPTSWFMAFDFIDVSRSTVLLFGILTSLPMWYLLGTALAARSETWGKWFRRYVTTALLWTLANILILALVAALAD